MPNVFTGTADQIENNNNKINNIKDSQSPTTEYPTVEAVKNYTAGEKVVDGGEIFNDYENNKALSNYSSASGYATVAGCKGFNVLSADRETVSSNDTLIDNARITTHDREFQNVSFEENVKYRVILKGEITTDTQFYPIDIDYISVPTLTSDFMILNNTNVLMMDEISYELGSYEDSDNYAAGYIRIHNNLQNNITFSLIKMSGNASFNITLDLSIYKINETVLENYILNICNTDGIEIDDKFSFYSQSIERNYDLIGTVKDIRDVNTLIVDNFPISILDNPTTQEYIWFPNKPYLNGDILLGSGAHSSGYQTKAIQIGSHTEGYNTLASGKYAHAEGNGTIAVYAAHSEGKGTQALGHHSHSEGEETVAAGGTSHAEGYQTRTEGYNTHAEGYQTKATNNASHAEGHKTLAQKDAAHAEGKSTIADGIGTHSEGEGCKNYAKASHTEGFNTKIGNFDDKGSLIAESTESFVGVHAEGYYTQAYQNGAHAEGEYSKAYGRGTHAEGMNTKSQSLSYDNGEIGGTHAEGYYTEASGIGTHSEGYKTKATGKGAHSEGRETSAEGHSSHAEGHKTIARGYNSHAEGSETLSHGMNSHASGKGTQALVDNQTVVGTYNVRDYKSTALFVVGNGSSDTDRKDAFTVNLDGSTIINTTNMNKSARNIAFGNTLPSNTNGYQDGDIFIVFEE